MSDFTRVIDKAISELVIAKAQPAQYAEAALVQARHHINIALDEARRKARLEPTGMAAAIGSAPQQREQV